MARFILCSRATISFFLYCIISVFAFHYFRIAVSVMAFYKITKIKIQTILTRHIVNNKQPVFA